MNGFRIDSLTTSNSPINPMAEAYTTNDKIIGIVFGRFMSQTKNTINIRNASPFMILNMFSDIPVDQTIISYACSGIAHKYQRPKMKVIGKEIAPQKANTL